jgi:hypothetical protein
LIVRGPDAVVEDGAVETAKGGDGCGNEGFTVFRSEERLLDGAAEFRAAAFGDQGFGLLCGGAVAEDDLRAGLAEEADGGCADSARAAGDKGDFAGERHYDPCVIAVRHILDAIESRLLTQVT